MKKIKKLKFWDKNGYLIEHKWGELSNERKLHDKINELIDVINKLNSPLVILGEDINLEDEKNKQQNSDQES